MTTNATILCAHATCIVNRETGASLRSLNPHANVIQSTALCGRTWNVGACSQT
jgi:hypothetical protein